MSAVDLGAVAVRVARLADELTRERDSARDLAVALEQRLTAAEEVVEAGRSLDHDVWCNVNLYGDDVRCDCYLAPLAPALARYDALTEES